jgi:5-formyltetrahydrofolate cyclo-ligase
VLKSQLRKKILKIRKITNKKNIQINFEKVLNILKEEKINKKNIGGYYPINFEVDILDILKKLEKKKFSICLPIIKKNYDMNFYKWSFDKPLKINKYGIPEPDSNILISPDVLLVPLVGFDKRLNRLGYGGGFYDRLIKKLNKKKKILKIGLALSSQKIDKVPINKYDQKLDYIVTDKYTIK